MAAPGLLYGLLAMVGFGFSNALTAEPTRKIGPTRALFYRNVFTSAFLLAVVLFAWEPQSIAWKGVLLALGLAVVGYVPLWAFMRATRTGKLGVVSPVANSSLVVTVLLSVFLLGETLNLGQMLVIAVIVAGIILISVNLRDWRSSHLLDKKSGVPYALVACLGWGLVFAFWKYPVGLIGPLLTAFLVELGGLLVAAVQLAAGEGFAKTDRRTLGILALLGAAGTLGVLFFNLGIATAAVSVVVTITLANPWIPALYGRFAHGERLAPQQYAGIFFIVAGLVALSLL